MTNGDMEYEVRKPGLVAVFVTIILGSGIAFVLATYMLNLSPAWIALLAGAVSSFLGFFILGESIGDAIVFSIGFSVLVFVFITAGPEIEIISISIVPIATGICVGKLTHGIWKEIR
jgi:drug/metabolite transporter (DMT)-like permease